MNRANECKYNVIEFSELPYKDIADYVCVPTSWVQSRGPLDRKVKVSYPIEDPSDTEERVRKRKKKSEEWTSFLSVVKHSTDDYDEAKRYIQDLIPETQKADNSLSSVKVEEKPRRSMRKTSSSTKINIMETLGLSPTFKTKPKSPKTKTFKRKALPEPDEEAHNKRSRVTEPGEADDEVVEPCSQANENQSVPHEDFNEELCTQETLVEKSNDSTESRPPVNQIFSEENPFLNPEADEFRRRVFRELQTSFQVYTSSFFTEVLNIFNNVAWRYEYPKNTPAEGPKLNEKIRNEDQVKEKDIDDDDDDDDEDDDEDQPLKKNSYPKQIKKVVLPPEYDANDSKWTLNYREPAPGLVELIPHTGVYVKALRLANCKRLSNDSKSLARKLLCEIFTASALRTCSWTGARAKAFDQHGTNVRPGLDENARTVLLNYVAEHTVNESWKKFEDQTILNSMRNKMQEMRLN